MCIGIDARFLTHPQAGGFKTYSARLIAALAEVDTDNEYLLYIDRPPGEAGLIPRRPNFTTRTLRGRFPIVGMPVREQIGLAVRATCDKLDLMHSPCLTAPLNIPWPSVVTIHDMLWFSPAKFWQNDTTVSQRKLMNLYYRYVPWFAAHRASAIVTVSEAAKQTIVTLLGLPPAVIHVTYEAASNVFRRLDDPHAMANVTRKFALPAGFILALGSADPRKNIATLVRSYALLPADVQQMYHLVIVLAHRAVASTLTLKAQSLGIEHRVRFLVNVSDQELAWLYNAASLFVFPSLYEGFGLPPLEAMACGTPVIAANNSSIPEIVGNAAVLIDAEDAAAMASAIARVLANLTFQTELVDKGLKQAARFSWIRCAHQTVAAYEAALAR